VAHQSNHHLLRSHDRLNAAEHITGSEGEKRNMKCGLTNYISAASAETIFRMYFCFLKVSSRWIPNLIVKYKPPSHTCRNVINFFINFFSKVGGTAQSA